MHIHWLSISTKYYCFLLNISQKRKRSFIQHLCGCSSAPGCSRLRFQLFLSIRKFKLLREGYTLYWHIGKLTGNSSYAETVSPCMALMKTEENRKFRTVVLMPPCKKVYKKLIYTDTKKIKISYVLILRKCKKEVQCKCTKAN